MLCDNSIEEPTSPTYRYAWNGTTWFDWRTRHACLTGVQAKPLPNNGQPKTDGDDEQPPEDNDDGSQDFAKPAPATSRAWTKAAWFFAA